MQVSNGQKYWPSETQLFNNFANKKLLQNFDPRCLQDYADSAVMLNNKRFELMFSPDVEADIFRHIPCNLKTYKNKLKVPSALVYGEKTEVLPVNYFNRFAKMNNIKLTKIANGGHMFPLEQPEETAAIITQIIKDW